MFARVSSSVRAEQDDPAGRRSALQEFNGCLDRVFGDHLPLPFGWGLRVTRSEAARARHSAPGAALSPPLVERDCPDLALHSPHGWAAWSLQWRDVGFFC